MNLQHCPQLCTGHKKRPGCTPHATLHPTKQTGTSTGMHLRIFKRHMLGKTGGARAIFGAALHLSSGDSFRGTTMLRPSRRAASSERMRCASRSSSSVRASLPACTSSDICLPGCLLADPSRPTWLTSQAAPCCNSKSACQHASKSTQHPASAEEALTSLLPTIEVRICCSTSASMLRLRLALTRDAKLDGCPAPVLLSPPISNACSMACI